MSDMGITRAAEKTPIQEIGAMPGLSRKPAAETICINDAGEIDGLF